MSSDAAAALVSTLSSTSTTKSCPSRRSWGSTPCRPNTRSPLSEIRSVTFEPPCRPVRAKPSHHAYCVRTARHIVHPYPPAPSLCRDHREGGRRVVSSLGRAPVEQLAEEALA